jgi:hypothetical protein
MEITPLLTSVENRGDPGRFVEKIFWGLLAGRIEAAIKKASTYMHGKWVLGTCFWKNIFGGEGEPDGRLPRAAGPHAAKRSAFKILSGIAGLRTELVLIPSSHHGIALQAPFRSIRRSSYTFISANHFPTRIGEKSGSVGHICRLPSFYEPNATSGCF